MGSDIRGIGDADQLIGVEESVAERMLEEAGAAHRVIRRDGEEPMRTMEAVPGRVNLSVEGGKVVSVEVES